MSTVITLFLLSQSVTDLYNLGNKYYEEGNYEKAIEVYESAVEHIAHAYLYYNLGNSYFKTGKLGKAILNYRKAYFFTPRDKDIANNLAFARNYRIDKIRQVRNPLVDLWSNTFHSLSMREAQMLMAIFFLIASILISYYIISRRSLFFHLFLISALLCIFFFVNWQAWATELNQHHAVVTTPEVNALSGPGEDYKEILVIHDGSEVKIKEIRGDYALIQLPGGFGGWIPNNTLEGIY